MVLHHELYVEGFKRYLQASSESHAEIAIGVFQDLLKQRSDYAKLQQEHQQALECLRIHAADDAGARLFLQSQL